MTCNLSTYFGSPYSCTSLAQAIMKADRLRARSHKRPGFGHVWPISLLPRATSFERL